MDLDSQMLVVIIHNYELCAINNKNILKVSKITDPLNDDQGETAERIPFSQSSSGLMRASPGIDSHRDLLPLCPRERSSVQPSVKA